MPRTRVWIMDGHNMIFALPALQRLQVSGRREEARAGLVGRLERFAAARGQRVLVVFDGNAMAANPEAIRGPLFEAVYTRRGEGVADDRILHEARVCLERGLAVTVVTDDIATIARELPRGVEHLGVASFWRRYIEPPVAGDDKTIRGDFSEVERALLEQAAAEQTETRRASPAPSGSPVRGPAGAVPPTAPGAAGESRRAALARKRERGRARQARRLGRRGRAGRR